MQFMTHPYSLLIQKKNLSKPRKNQNFLKICGNVQNVAECLPIVALIILGKKEKSKSHNSKKVLGVFSRYELLKYDYLELTSNSFRHGLFLVFLNPKSSRTFVFYYSNPIIQRFILTLGNL